MEGGGRGGDDGGDDVGRLEDYLAHVMRRGDDDARGNEVTFRR